MNIIFPKEVLKMQKKLCSLFLTLILLSSTVSVFAAEPELYDDRSDPDLQREIEKCADFVIKEFGVDPADAKEKCSREMKEGERRPPEDYYGEPQDIKERYSDDRKPEDDEFYEGDFKFERPEGKYGYDRPSIEGHEEFFIQELIFEKIGEDLGDVEEIMDEYCDDQDAFLEIILERAADTISNVGSVCAQLNDKVATCEDDVDEHCNFGSDHEELYITPDGEEIYFESGWTCPADEDKWIRSCIKRSDLDNQYRDYEIECEDEWYFNEDMFLDECGKNEWCDEEFFFEDCERKQEEEEKWRREEEENQQRREEEEERWREQEEENRQREEDENQDSGDDRFCHTDDDISRFEDDCDADNEFVEFYYDGSDCVSGMYCKTEEEPPEEETPPHEEPPEDTNPITGNLISGMATYDDANQYSTMSCEDRWEEQEEGCAWSIATCSEDKFIPFCVNQREENSEQNSQRSERWCERNAEREMSRIEKQCETFEDDQENCRKMETKRCEELENAIDKCYEKVTPEKIEEEIKQKISHECRIYRYDVGFEDFDDEFRPEEGEDNLKEVVLALDKDITASQLVELATLVQELQESAEVAGIKLYKGLIKPFGLDELKELEYVIDAKYNTISTIRRQQRGDPTKGDIEEVLKKLLAIRQSSDIPEEYAPIIEAYAGDLIEVSEELDEIEAKEKEKGFGYGFQNFLGLVKEAEAEEIAQIQASKEKLEVSIAELKKLLEEVPDLTAKATLQAQIDTLIEQKEDLEKLMEKKEKKSKGWFNFLFN